MGIWSLCSMVILLQVSVTSFQNVVISFHYEVTLFHLRFNLLHPIKALLLVLKSYLRDLETDTFCTILLQKLTEKYLPNTFKDGPSLNDCLTDRPTH